MTISEAPFFTRRHIVGSASRRAGGFDSSSNSARKQTDGQRRIAKPGRQVSEAALQETIAALARPCQQDGSATGSWRDQLQGIRPVGRAQGSDHRGDSGMGRAAAIAYAREGADLAINYFPTEEPDAKEVIDLIKAEGRVAVAIPGDLRDEKFCQELVRRAVEGLGGLDILVSNAGRQHAHDSILDISSEDFDATIKTNIYAPFGSSRRRCRTSSPARSS